VSVSGNVRRPGNYEVELGISSREIIEGLAGGCFEGRRVKFWHPGGSSAPVLTDEHLDLAYDFETMAQAGSMLGSGAIIVADDTVQVLPYAKRLAHFYRHESCGKCVPCREGTNWTEKMFERMEQGLATPMDLEIMAEVQQNIEGNCLCVLGDSMAMPVRSLLKHFKSEFAEAIEAGRFAAAAVASAEELAAEHAGHGAVDVRAVL
jgi:NADH-quinone oxidoreductase subunit F